MRPGLLILPFLAILIGAVGTAVGSAFPQSAWLSALGWATAAALAALWVVLDFENFKSFFTRKGAKYGASSGAVVLLGVLVIVGIAVLSSRPRFNKSLDVTRDRLNTLSDQSLKIIENLDKTSEPVTITGFFTDDQVELKFRDLVALYQAEGATFKVEYVDPQVDPTRAMAAKISSGNTVVISSGHQEKRITTFNEEKLTNALVNILKKGSKKVYFTTGHGEGELRGTDPTGFSFVVEELENNKYGVESLSLLEEAKVPDDADLVVVAGPKYDFKEEELRMLDEYLKGGGSVFAMIDSMVPSERMGSLFEKFGVRLQNDLLILSPNDIRAQLLGQNTAIVSDFDDFNPITKDFASQSAVAVMMQNTRSLSEVEDNPHKMKVELAAKTGAFMVKVKDVKVPSDLESLTEDRLETGAFAVMAVATGKINSQSIAGAQTDEGDRTDSAAQDDADAKDAETRLVVIGSTQFATNQGVQSAEHMDLFMNTSNYLLQDEDFISIRPKDPTKSTISLASAGSQLSLLILAFIYPFLFLGSGTVYWMKRRRA